MLLLLPLLTGQTVSDTMSTLYLVMIVAAALEATVS
jgi:hypothetical protein